MAGRYVRRLIWVDPRAPGARLQFDIEEVGDAYAIATLLDAYLHFQVEAGILAAAGPPQAHLEELTADGDWVELELAEPLIPAPGEDE